MRSNFTLQATASLFTLRINVDWLTFDYRTVAIESVHLHKEIVLKNITIQSPEQKRTVQVHAMQTCNNHGDTKTNRCCGM